MPNVATFRIRYNYPDSRLEPGITLPVTLMSNSRVVDVVAKVDPGSDFCLFTKDVGEALALDIESGSESRFATLGGIVVGYGHVVVMETFGIRFESSVYFSSVNGVNRNILGRNGWLDRVRLAIVHHDRELFLSPYEDE